ERVLARRSRLDLVPRAAQCRLERAQDLGLVVHDEDVRAHGLVGSERAKLAPLSRPGSASSRAPFACANPWAIASPSPLPLLGTRPCSNGSKIRSNSPSSRPGPWSTTRTISSP